MPIMEAPRSKFLNVADWKYVLKEAKTEKERLCVILEPAYEAKTNPEMVRCIVHNPIVGDKEIYDYKNKFYAFFEVYTNNTDEWVGKMLKPVVPEKESLFFVRFDTVAALEENIAE
jgi:hypothetical protein